MLTGTNLQKSYQLPLPQKYYTTLKNMGLG